MTSNSKVEEQSFGVIPIQRREDQILFLLIQHRGGHWAFPKGHANVGETALEAARRELREETGIRDVEIKTDQIFEERYTKPRWREPRKIIVKSVRYFIGEVTNPRLRLQASEVQNARWVVYAEARKLITFDASRALLDDAARALKLQLL